MRRSPPRVANQENRGRNHKRLFLCRALLTTHNKSATSTYSHAHRQLDEVRGPDSANAHTLDRSPFVLLGLQRRWKEERRHCRILLQTQGYPRRRMPSVTQGTFLPAIGSIAKSKSSIDTRIIKKNTNATEIQQKKDVRIVGNTSMIPIAFISVGATIYCANGRSTLYCHTPFLISALLRSRCRNECVSTSVSPSWARTCISVCDADRYTS